MLDQQRFIKEALAAHNKLRKKHGAPELQHNPELSKIALDWAQYIASRRTLKHSSNKFNNRNLGENLAMWSSTGATHFDGEKATMQWYDEIKDYNFAFGNFSSGTGHFTQVVWKNSEQVGFAVAKSSDGAFYAVGNYYPAGNLIGAFKENVLPPGSIPSDSTIPQQSKSNVQNQKSNQDVKQTIEIDDSQERFAQEALNAHNLYRRKHGVPPLRLNKTLNGIAMNWAKKIASENKMRRSESYYQGAQLGESIALYGHPELDYYDGRYATEQWYETIKHHDFDGDYNENSATFSQLVWRDTKEVGFGFARASNGYFYAVANYFPSGNYDDQFYKNVFPPL